MLAGREPRALPFIWPGKREEGRKEGGVRSFVRCWCCNVSVTSVLKRGGRGVTYSKKKKKRERHFFYIQGDSKLEGEFLSNTYSIWLTFIKTECQRNSLRQIRYFRLLW